MAEPGSALPRRLWPLLPGLLLLAGAGGLAALERFDGLYGQDPFAYFAYSTGPLRESLLRGAPPPPFFWPPGFPLLVALASVVVGPVPLAGQLVSLLAGACVPVFTALLACEIRPGADRPAGEPALLVPMTAGLFAACTGQLWQSSVVVMADTTGLALATAGVWALARYGRGAGGGWLLLASSLLAWATLARWIYGLVAVPITLYALAMLARRGARTAVAHAAGAALCVLVVLGPVLLPALDRLAAGSEGLAPFAGNFQVYSWHPARALGREFATVDGLLRHELPNGLYYALAPARWAYFTPLLAPLVLPGLWSLVRRRTPELLLLVGGWAAVVYAFHAGAPYQNFRFTLAYLPPLAILAALGVARLRRRLEGYPAWPAGASLLVGFGLMVAAGVRTTHVLVQRKNDSVATAGWAGSRLPAEARLVTFGLTLTARHYTPLEVLDLFDLDAPRMAALVGAARPVFLLADTAVLATQWRERSPGENFRWLRDGPGLTPVGRRREYTLFLVGPGAPPGGPPPGGGSRPGAAPRSPPRAPPPP